MALLSCGGWQGLAMELLHQQLICFDWFVFAYGVHSRSPQMRKLVKSLSRPQAEVFDVFKACVRLGLQYFRYSCFFRSETLPDLQCFKTTMMY